MKYTITGANGNLGSQIVKEMKNKVTIDKLSLGVHTPSKSKHYKNEGFELHQVEYFEEESMEKAFEDTKEIYIL